MVNLSVITSKSTNKIKGRRSLLRIGAMLVFGAVGCFLIFRVTASPAVVSFEPESQASGCVSKVNDTTASGGAAARFDGCTTNDSPLPFSRASTSTLRASNKKVFAHYFTPYPLQINNRPASEDYYATGYLNPNGESGKHAAYGGFLRERPLAMPVSGSADWQLNNMKLEVRRAIDAGLDGFAVDILSLSGYNWDRFMLLLQASHEVDPGFKLMLMPDANASATNDATALANAMAGLVNGPYGGSIFKVSGGRAVVSPFKAEGKSVDYWKTVINVMKGKGVDVAFVPCFLNYQNNVAAFAPISYGFSNWGNRNPDGNKLADLTSLANNAKSRGGIWMQPVSVQDSRPVSGAFWEANNTENLRATWAAANANAEWVQIPTWNDYSENAQISPSTHIGWSLLDLNAFYITKYKTGQNPTINKDVIYLSHRVHPANAAPTGPQTLLQTVRASTPPRDKVEVAAFLRQASTIEVNVGGTVSRVSAPAGVSTHLFDLRTGKITAKVVVNGATTASLASPFTVVSRPVVQDLMYHFVSSARGNQGIGAYNDSMSSTK